MDLGLSGRAFLVTGGSSGLGLALAALLVEEGAVVTIVGRNIERLQATKHSLPSGQVLAVAGDVCSPTDCARIVGETSEHWGRLDGLANVAGHHTGTGFEQITDQEWRDDFELKLISTARLTRLALPALRESRGSVLNVLSIWSRFQQKGGLPSSALRAAGLALTKVVAAEHAAHGIRANALLVGLIRSGQWDQEAEEARTTPAEYVDQIARTLRIPLGRAGEPSEFAGIAAFLLSSRAGYITGTALNVDGGLSPVP